MYQLTSNPDVVQNLQTGACIPRGHRWWDEFEAWVAAGGVPEAAIKTLPQLVAETKAMISRWLDEVVQSKGYDNIVSCASYATSTNATFRAEAEAAIAWRDAVYAMGYELLADIPSNITTPEHVLALMPLPTDFGWPA